MSGRGAGAGLKPSVHRALFAAALVWGCAAEARPTPGAAAPGDAPAAAPERRVVITYDDLPANSYVPSLEIARSITEGLVEGLVRNEVPAIGFVNETKLYPGGGDLDSARVALLDRWLAAGLELGNHSFSHPDFHSTPLAQYERDVLRGEEVTRALSARHGRAPRFFRHPFLHTGRSLEDRTAFEAFLAEHGYRVAPVTIDNGEWIFARAYDHALLGVDETVPGRIADAYLDYMAAVFAYYESQSTAIVGYELPQILLLHANQLNAATVDRMMEMIRGRGYAFIPLETALEDPAYASPDTYVGPSGITWLHRWALTDGKRGEFFAGEPEVPGWVQAIFDAPPGRPTDQPPTRSNTKPW